MLTLSLIEHSACYWGVLQYQGKLLRLEFNHTSIAACRQALISPSLQVLKELSHLGVDDQLLQDIEPLETNQKLIKLINQYLSGKDVSLQEVHLHIYSGWSPLKTRVMHITRNIPYGETMSYAELAVAAGAPGAARAIGSMMASNPYPLVVPCHRVLGSGAKLGGYSAPGGLTTKKALLNMEREAQSVSTS